MKKKIIDNWYAILIGLFLLSVAAVYAIFGESSHIAVHDNLDLFVAQFQMLKNTDSFFAHGVDVPFLGGVTRDNLPSELSLYTLLYFFLPSFAAYITGYLLKVILAVFSVWVLARDWYGEEFEKYKPLAAMFGLSYGVLNMFPAFGIPFASIPLALYLLRQIYRRPSAKWYVALFCYPFLSYFSYFGFFILAYLSVGIIWLSFRDKKVAVSLIGALFVLGLGYVLFEYRLFYVMLFGGVETIRSTMVEADLPAGRILAQSVDVWMHGMFHAESVHDKLVLWICVVYFFYLNGKYLVKKNGKGIFHDIYNLVMLVLVFNSLVYGIYNWGAFRGLVETLLPPLKGFQFNRTVFFSPFLWYAAFFLILQRGYGLSYKMAGVPAGSRNQQKSGHQAGRGWRQYLRKFPRGLRLGANVLAVLAFALILFTPSRYNDLYHTCKNKALEIWKGKETDEMNYEEFYSVELFRMIKQDIGYEGEWAAAYGFHPAVLEYNGIATLDGYLGFYPQQYKEDFRQIIAPAIERMEPSRIYYDDWGARAYLYSGTEASAVSTLKSFAAADQELYINSEAFVQMGGEYIFSRFALSNAEALGMELAGVYGTDGKPYAVYVYAPDV